MPKMILLGIFKIISCDLAAHLRCAEKKRAHHIQYYERLEKRWTFHFHCLSEQNESGNDVRGKYLNLT